MHFLPVIILAIIQGITEFLPISSSAHLILVSEFADFQEKSLIIDISLHLGTLLAVIFYFRSDFISIFLSFFKENEYSQRILGRNIMIATIPIIIIGGLIYSTEMVNLLRNIQVIALATIFFGVVLYFADIKKSHSVKSIDQISLKGAILIGFFQVLSVIPGTSRSGITYTAGRILNISRYDAAKFSMLISVPTILISSSIPIIEFIKSPNTDQLMFSVVGFLISFIVAYVSISVLLNWVKNHSMKLFVIYRIILGSLLLAITLV
tara:strand:- start:8061 stop:8855 length:795 start_codon:yes stop_codon:yes gene_type:complete